MDQGQLALAGGKDKGDQQGPTAESVGAGGGTVTQTEVPTQNLCPHINHRRPVRA